MALTKKLQTLKFLKKYPGMAFTATEVAQGIYNRKRITHSMLRHTMRVLKQLKQGRMIKAEKVKHITLYRYEI